MRFHSAIAVHHCLCRPCLTADRQRTDARGNDADLGACAWHRLCFIEAIIHTDDCSRELLEWGSRVAAFNARPPNPQ